MYGLMWFDINMYDLKVFMDEHTKLEIHTDWGKRFGTNT